jgi:hypothetical protein
LTLLSLKLIALVIFQVSFWGAYIRWFSSYWDVTIFYTFCYSWVLIYWYLTGSNRFLNHFENLHNFFIFLCFLFNYFQ